nr:response regulator [uncultured Arsenicibacter sp.]
MNPSMPVSILIVEDEAILAMDLCARLEAEGYQVTGTAATGRQALTLYQQHQTDIVICDINLAGDWNGVETIQQLLAFKPLPVIYLSALTDRETVEMAKSTKPAAYLTKPITTDCLRIAIEIAMSNFAYLVPASHDQAAAPKPRPAITMAPAKDSEMILQVGDHIFIKQNYQFVRVRQSDVLYVEADDKYTTLVTSDRKFVLRLSMGVLLQRLSDQALVRVHRSYAVNLTQIESFNDYEVQIKSQVLPLGRAYKEDFLQHFRFR